jgi:integrase
MPREAMLQAYENKANNLPFYKTADFKSALDTVNSIRRIDGVTPHIFRHTWATNKIMTSANIKDVSEFMGDTEKTVRKN